MDSFKNKVWFWEYTYLNMPIYVVFSLSLGQL